MTKATECVIVVLDGTDATARLVAELSAAGNRVTAVGTNFRDVGPVRPGAVPGPGAAPADPALGAPAVWLAAARHGTVDTVLDPAGRLAARAA